VQILRSSGAAKFIQVMLAPVAIVHLDLKHLQRLVWQVDVWNPLERGSGKISIKNILEGRGRKEEVE